MKKTTLSEARYLLETLIEQANLAGGVFVEEDGAANIRIGDNALIHIYMHACKLFNVKPMIVNQVFEANPEEPIVDADGNWTTPIKIEETLGNEIAENANAFAKQRTEGKVFLTKDGLPYQIAIRVVRRRRF